MKYSLFLLCMSLLSPVLAADRGSMPHDHHQFPVAVGAFHGVMAPLWHAPAGGVRRRQICEAVPRLTARAEAVVAAPVPIPAQAAGPAWREAAAALQQQTVELEPLCGQDDGPAIDRGFAELHHAFHELVRLVGHRH